MREVPNVVKDLANLVDVVATFINEDREGVESKLALKGRPSIFGRAPELAYLRIDTDEQVNIGYYMSPQVEP
jgi:hypothetical protein